MRQLVWLFFASVAAAQPAEVVERVTILDGRVMEIRRPAQPRNIEAARGVAAPRPFPVRHEGHNCPACGRPQYVIERQLLSGEHVHTCAACRTSWRH